MRSVSTILSIVLAQCLALLLCGATAAQSPRVSLDIQPQPVRAALQAFGDQTGMQVLYRIGDVSKDGVTSAAVRGELSAREALERLLANTGLKYEFINERTVRISAPVKSGAAVGTATQSIQLARVEQQVEDEPIVGSSPASQAKTAEQAALVNSAGIPEILVKGARSSNTDIRRTEDDVQPYVVFDAEEIGRSMAPDLETFLRTRLPMNQSRISAGQSMLGATTSTSSSIDLRGLGDDQTLILVNGRRMPGPATSNGFLQPDINGIPPSAVERIEILPSTAGGIYGGGATGGVVNIILKRDYNDLELTARYDGTFAGGGAQRRLDATAGFTLEGGRTHVMLTASYRDGNPLYIGDRDFTARARALQEENNHAAFRSNSIPLWGYTTNIRSNNGSNLVLKPISPGGAERPLNSPIASVPVGYAGPGSDNGAAFLGTADQYNLAVADDVLGNQYSLLNAPSVRSLQLSVRREFTDRIEAFVDATRYDNRSVRMGSGSTTKVVTLPAGPNNPFTQAVRLSVPLVGYENDRIRSPSQSLSEQLSGGMIVRLPRDWMVQGEYSLGRSTSTYGFTRTLLSADGNAALIDGRLDPLSDVNAYPLDFSAFYPGETGRRNTGDHSAERENTTLRVSGPLLQLPGGPLRLAALIERRAQFTGDRVSASTSPTSDTTTFSYFPEVGSSTNSGYAELNAPLVSAANARPGLQGLDLRASYRYDTTETRTRPSDESSVRVPSPDGPFPQVPFQTNSVTGNQYTLGLRYTPVESVMLRVSYGEGILPPAPAQLSEFDASFIAFVLGSYLDPKRGGLPVNTATIEQYLFGGSLLLRPEHSASWSGGVIFTPVPLPGLRLSVDYTRIEKIDEIGALGSQGQLNLEDDFPGTIVRNELTAADAALGYTGGTIRIFNGGNVNIAKSLAEAFDIQADYSWETRFGSFAANVLATVQPRLSQRATPDGADMDTVGYNNGPLKWRANAGLRFSRGAWDLAWNLQYYDASLIYFSSDSAISRNTAVLNQGSELIPTQTYHDVYGRYRFENASGFAGGLLQNTELQISVQNVLNTSPPILASATNIFTQGYATEGDARLRRYSIAFTKRFGR